MTRSGRTGKLFTIIIMKLMKKNKKESNLILVAKLIKNRYPNVDDGDRKTPFKQMGINQRREAVDLKLLLDECDRIIEFWPFLCIAEEQLREKRENEEWKYQRKLGEIKFELMGLLDIEEGKGIDLIENLENEKQNLSKMDKLINGLYLSTMRNEAEKIKERVIRAKQCKRKKYKNQILTTIGYPLGTG
ncbi:unnamed protein product [Meloidogyne enterolobii]|uniref:Uncharacterized protein n=2 Tax=Meloidogyne enterolobii TaxID=390850 RepID=A0A6V7XDF0_MELEN|nr:unnamed protein product [Meloidogyne enterolobii]